MLMRSVNAVTSNLAISLLLGLSIDATAFRGVTARAVPALVAAPDLGERVRGTSQPPKLVEHPKPLGLEAVEPQSFWQDEFDDAHLAPSAPLDEVTELERLKKENGLHGKFLHITDIVSELHC